MPARSDNPYVSRSVKDGVATIKLYRVFKGRKQKCGERTFDAADIAGASDYIATVIDEVRAHQRSLREASRWQPSAMSSE